MPEVKRTLDHFGNHFLGLRVWSEGFPWCVHKGQQIRTLDQESDQAKMKMSEPQELQLVLLPAAAESCGFWPGNGGNVCFLLDTGKVI